MTWEAVGGGRGGADRQHDRAVGTVLVQKGCGFSMYRALAKALFRHPLAIPDAIRAAWAFRSRSWYRRFPFLPIPPRSYLEWRIDTAYGSVDADPPAEELIGYLRWSRRMRSRG